MLGKLAMQSTVTTYYYALNKLQLRATRLRVPIKKCMLIVKVCLLTRVYGSVCITIPTSMYYFSELVTVIVNKIAWDSYI